MQEELKFKGLFTDIYFVVVQYDEINFTYPIVTHQLKREMKKIALISCVKKKLPKKSRAEELYTSDWFKKALQFAKKLCPDDIFILSAKYGLLDLDDEIEPYNITLNKMPVKERNVWAEGVLKQLNKKFDLKNDYFIFLAGNRYRQNILSELNSYEIPMEGLPFGKQKQYLKRQLSDV